MIQSKPCPKCGCTANVVHKDEFMHGQNHAALHHGSHFLHGAVHGHPLGLALVAFSWAGSKFLHGISKPWRCNACRHDFA